MTTSPRLTALVALLLAGCAKPAPDRAAESAAATPTPAASRSGFTLEPAQRARLHLVTVQPTSFRPTIAATGTVVFNGDHSTPVLSPVSGPALRILVNPGAVVRQGQPLATVSSPDFATAVADLRKAESGFQNMRRIADLDSQLFRNDALARRELEQAQTDAAGAVADRDAAIQQLRALGVGPEQIEAIRTGRGAAPLEAVIRAPIAGTVVEKLISPGQLLQAGTTPCFTVADLSTMWVMASVFADDMPNVSVGETVDVTTDAATAPLAGRVDYVASIVDPGSKAVAVRVLVPNVGQLLRRDMFVRVAIHAARERSGMLVPSSAVLRDEDNLPFVFVAARGESFDRRRVTLGQQIGDGFEVRSGLTAGERIVTDGALFLQFAESQ